jgi:hypothetical protein
MSQIDHQPARSFFAELLTPLKRANARLSRTYLSRSPDPTSYWREVRSRTGGTARLSAATCDGAALLQSLAQYWGTQNDEQLPKLLPHLVELREAIIQPEPQSPVDLPEAELPEFVYVLF